MTKDKIQYCTHKVTTPPQTGIVGLALKYNHSTPLAGKVSDTPAAAAAAKVQTLTLRRHKSGRAGTQHSC